MSRKRNPSLLIITINYYYRLLLIQLQGLNIFQITRHFLIEMNAMGSIL